MLQNVSPSNKSASNAVSKNNNGKKLTKETKKHENIVKIKYSNGQKYHFSTTPS